MKIRLIKQSWKWEQQPPKALKIISAAARTCYQSKPSDTSPEELVKKLLTLGHHSQIEHASASVRIVTDRGVSHELVRHRLASFSQESTRYCRYDDGPIVFIIPVWLEHDLDPGYYDYYDMDYSQSPKSLWLHSCISESYTYSGLLSGGWRPEQARTVLNNSLKTELVITANLREWRHIFSLRTSNAAHPQMRALMRDMLKGFKENIPIIFDDIGGEPDA